MSLAMTAGAVFVWAATAAAAPPANTTLPSITGTPKVGETLTAQNGTWTNSPTSFQYQWQRCDGAGASCVNIAGAVEKTYLLKAAEANHTLRVRVLAVNADGSASARSGPTAVVTAGTAPVNTARPSITGDARVGETLTAEDGTWTQQSDLVRVPVAAVRCRRHRLCRDLGLDREDLRRASSRPRLPVARRGDREERRRRRLGPVGTHADRRSDRSDHKQAAHADDRLGPVRRRPGLRAVPRSATTRRRISRSSPRTPARARRPTRGASRPGLRRIRVAPTPATGCRCSASAGRAGTRSPFRRVTRPAW